MEALGFNGAVLDLVRDMYCGDVLFLQVNGELCPALYLTQGLKQGCNLSPIFFNLVMVDMARRYQESGEGGWLGKKRVPGILFADDLGLTATSETGLRRLIDITAEEGARFNMKILVKKSKIMILSAKKGPVVFTMPMELEVVAFYKYLGVQIEARPNALYYKAYEQVIVKKARKYLNLIRVRSRAFPDVAVAVFQLWHSVALPSILYGMESTAVSVATWRTLESIQARLGKFILQAGIYIVLVRGGRGGKMRGWKL